MTKVADNESDDDVIEVVRDDAPIEILSDGEELELEKMKQAQNNVNVIQNYFTAPSSEPNIDEPKIHEPNIDELNIEIDVNRCEEDHIIDPITNTETTSNEIISNCIPMPLENPMLMSLDSKTDNVKEDKSNHDEENVYVNVTDDGNINEPTQSEIAMDPLDQKDQVEQNQNPVENSCNSVCNLNDVPGDLPLKASETVTESI